MIGLVQMHEKFKRIVSAYYLQSRSLLGKKNVETIEKIGEFFYRQFTSFGQTGPTTALSSLAGGDKWLPGMAVHGINQVPGVLIGHRHRFCRSGDRAEFPDSLKQNHSAEAEIGLAVFFDPDSSPAAKPLGCLLRVHISATMPFHAGYLHINREQCQAIQCLAFSSFPGLPYGCIEAACSFREYGWS
jgi:hypothetical protein